MNDALAIESSGAQAPAHDPVLTPLTAAANRVGTAELAERLSALRAWLADELATLEASIRDATDGTEDRTLAERAAAWLIARPGKRVRPLCVVLAARVGGRGLDPAVRDAAVAAELVHAATLLHDDVIDVGDTRRGAAAARVVYGNSASILAGDHLLVEALRRIDAGPRGGDPALLTRMLDVIGQMVRAEALQLERRGRFDPDRGAYLDIIDGKTASLFRWSLWAGGRLGGLDRDVLDALDSVGTALGRAFQLVDDVLDLAGDPAVCGKSLLADVREGKLTWPLIGGAERDPQVAAMLARWLETEAEPDAAEVGALQRRLRACGAIDDARAFARSCADDARDALVALPPGPARVAIDGVITAAVERAR